MGDYYAIVSLGLGEAIRLIIENPKVADAAIRDRHTSKHDRGLLPRPVRAHTLDQSAGTPKACRDDGGVPPGLSTLLAH